MRLTTLSAAGGACIALLLGAASAAADPPRVVTSILPLQSLAANVMGDLGAPELVVEGAASPHNFALRPSDARSLQNADLVIWIGEGLETFLVAPLASLSGKARVLELAETNGISLLPPRKTAIWEEHGAENHEHGEEDHGHGAYDPHIWLDIGNAIAALEAIAAELSRLDPPNAGVYRANAQRTAERLKALDAEFHERLEALIGRRYLVFHDGYHYFEARYGLKPLGAVAIAPGRDPGARHLAELRARIAEERIRCVFSEPQFEPKLLEVVTEGSAARGAILDPLGAELEAGPEAYFTLMLKLVESLEDCLGRPPA